MRSLEDRLALVTGGTRGIGLAIAQHLLGMGAKVIVACRNSGGVGRPSGAEYLAADFYFEGAVDLVVRRIADRNVDILVNNAGYNRPGPTDVYDPGDYRRLQRLNVEAPFRLCQAVLPGMKARGWGRIVNISSIFGIVGRPERAAYCTSKFAIDGLTAGLAAEVAKDGILVNTVAPGFIETDLTRQVLGEDGMRGLAAQVPMGRLGKPNEVAALVGWLVSPENTYVSGARIAIDGGFSRV